METPDLSSGLFRIQTSPGERIGVNIPEWDPRQNEAEARILPRPVQGNHGEDRPVALAPK